MKKFLSLAVLVGALAVLVGCEEKKSTGGPVTKVTPTATDVIPDAPAAT